MRFISIVATGREAREGALVEALGILHKVSNRFGMEEEGNRNRKYGKDRGPALRVSHTINSIFWGPSELAEEASEPRTVGTRFSTVQPGLPPPSETDSATGKEQKDERDECHPEPRCSVGDKIRVVQSADLALDEREKGDVYSKRDEGDEGGEERGEGREERDRDMGGEREEECDE